MFASSMLLEAANVIYPDAPSIVIRPGVFGVGVTVSEYNNGSARVVLAVIATVSAAPVTKS